MRMFTSAGWKRQQGDKDMLSNWRSPPRPGAKSSEQGRPYNRRNREVGRRREGGGWPVVAMKRSNVCGAKGPPAICNVSNIGEGKDEMKSGPDKAPAEQVLKDIRRQTRRQYSAEEKIRIVLEGLRGEENISELCRREGIAASMYYGWSKEFLEAGKRRLAGDTARAATSGEVKDLRREATALKEVVADLTLENRLLKKSMSGDGEDEA